MVIDSAPFGCEDITSDCDSVAIFTSLLQKAIGILAGSTFFRVTHQEIERALNNVGKKREIFGSLRVFQFYSQFSSSMSNTFIGIASVDLGWIP